MIDTLTDAQLATVGGGVIEDEQGRSCTDPRRFEEIEPTLPGMGATGF